MAAIDVLDGDRVWEQDIGSSHGAWVAGDYVYVLSNDNELLCLTRNDGKVRWLRQLPNLVLKSANESRSIVRGLRG